MKRRSTPRRTCDAAGCTAPGSHAAPFCPAHWRTIPQPIRDRITDAKRAGRFRDFAAACLEARNLHARRARAAVTTPQAAYANAARLLGERE